MREIEYRDHARIALPAPVIYLGLLLAGLVISILFPFGRMLPEGISLALGAVLLIAASAMSILSVREMRIAGTSPNPSKRPSKLVTSGPFSFSRNPIYLSFSLGYVGLSLTLGLIWSLALIIVALVLVDRFVISREEEYLGSKFGLEYVRYKSKTRRWL